MSNAIVNGALNSINPFPEFAAEPKSSLGRNFKSLVSSLGISGGLGTQLTSALSGLDPQSATLIAEQVRQEQQMQTVSLISNVDHAKHEMAMAPIRNIRVS